MTLTFGAIEAIIGAPLSVSAMNMPTAWHRATQMHVRRWREMGWRVRYDRRNRSVHFTRDAEE